MTTHKELEEIKAAFKLWAAKESRDDFYKDISSSSAVYEYVAKLFWPFLEQFYIRQADPARGVYADEMREVYRLKKRLEMALMAHENLGVDE